METQFGVLSQSSPLEISLYSAVHCPVCAAVRGTRRSSSANVSPRSGRDAIARVFLLSYPSHTNSYL